MKKSFFSLVFVLGATLLFGFGCNFSTNGKAPVEDGTMGAQSENMQKEDPGVMINEESSESMMKEDDKMPGDEAVEDKMENKDNDMINQVSGTYEDYDTVKLALAGSGKVVLFFKASWCPTCNALNKDVEAHLKDIPSDVHILKVDYDNSAELKKKYGVTYQHTFVQVDSDGEQLNKWAGSPTLKDLVANIK